MEHIDKLISRNLNGFPEHTADSIVSRRCYYFTQGVLVFRPYLDCTGCASSFALEDIPSTSIAEDPSETLISCPGCSTPGQQMLLKVLAMETKSDPGTIVICARDLLQCDLFSLLPQDAKATDFGEEVHYLFPKQLGYKLAKFMLGQPLLLVNKVELIKHQPTLAYNLEMLGEPEAMMLRIVEEFLRLSKEEASNTIQPSFSIGEILPSSAHLPDEQEVKEEAPAPVKDCKQCGHAAEAHFTGCSMCPDQFCTEGKERKLTTYVWKNYFSKGIEIHTYQEQQLIRPGGIYRENPSREVMKASLKHVLDSYPKDKHSWVMTHSLWVELDMPNSRLFNSKDRWVFDNKVREAESCPFCTASDVDLTVLECRECNFAEFTEEKLKDEQKEKLAQYIERQEAEAKETVEKQMEQLSLQEIQDNSVMYVRRKDKDGNYRTIPLEEADKLTDIPEE